MDLFKQHDRESHQQSGFFSLFYFSPSHITSNQNMEPYPPKDQKEQKRTIHAAKKQVIARRIGSKTVF